MKILKINKVIQTQIELSNQELMDIIDALSIATNHVFSQYNANDRISPEKKANLREQQRRVDEILEMLRSIQ